MAACRQALAFRSRRWPTVRSPCRETFPECTALLDEDGQPVQIICTTSRGRKIMTVKTSYSRARQNLASLWDEVEDSRSEEHTSELQSLMRISYAVFCL